MRSILRLAKTVLFVSMLGGVQTAVASTEWDLVKQFPFTPFSFVQGNTPLPTIADWQPPFGIGGTPYIPQPAYAPGSRGSPMINHGHFLPAWFKMTRSLGGQVKGDVIVHTTDPYNGIGEGPASVLFVAPAGGLATISGYVYAAGFATPGRPEAWSVFVNGTVVASGTDPDDGSINRSHPAKFLFKTTLNQGDVVALTIVQTSGVGTFMGTNLRITIE
jgi:hypothetical protein